MLFASYIYMSVFVLGSFQVWMCVSVMWGTFWVLAPSYIYCILIMHLMLKPVKVHSYGETNPVLFLSIHLVVSGFRSLINHLTVFTCFSSCSFLIISSSQEIKNEFWTSCYHSCWTWPIKETLCSLQVILKCRHLMRNQISATVSLLSKCNLESVRRPLGDT